MSAAEAPMADAKRSVMPKPIRVEAIAIPGNRWTAAKIKSIHIYSHGPFAKSVAQRQQL